MQKVMYGRTFYNNILQNVVLKTDYNCHLILLLIVQWFTRSIPHGEPTDLFTASTPQLLIKRNTS